MSEFSYTGLDEEDEDDGMLNMTQVYDTNNKESYQDNEFLEDDSIPSHKLLDQQPNQFIFGSTL